MSVLSRESEATKAYLAIGTAMASISFASIFIKWSESTLLFHTNRMDKRVEAPSCRKQESACCIRTGSFDFGTADGRMDNFLPGKGCANIDGDRTATMSQVQLGALR